MPGEDRSRWRLPHFVSAALSDVDVRVASLRGADELGSPYEIHVVVQIDQDDPIDTAGVLEAPAALYWTREGGAPEGPFYGVVREVELIASRPGHWIQYRLVLVSPLWLLTQTLRTRVYLELSSVEIVDQVLKGAGFETGTDYEWNLSGTYRPRRYVVQYQESDYDFISRLLEHDGIFAFSHADDGHERLVLGDHSAAFATPDPSQVEFSPAGDDAIERRWKTFQHRHASVPRHVISRDYDAGTPNVALQHEHRVSELGLGMVFLTDDHPLDDNDVRRLARVRAEELAVSEHTFRAVGTVVGLRAGQIVELVAHHVGDLNGRYLVVSVDYEQGYDEHASVPVATAELIRADVPYRPARLTKKPRIYGIVPAHVDGADAGIPAPIDDEGRYRVLLPFDGAGAPGGRASCWIRLAQTFAGPGYGMHFPLHTGTEVLIAHVDGDPDRPLIVGAVPNPATVTPVIDTNATQSVIRTKAGIVQEYEDDALVEG